MHVQSEGAPTSKGKTMKTRRGQSKLNAVVVAAVTLLQVAGVAASAQTCMTQDLFLYMERKKESAKVVGTRARSIKEKNSSNGPESSKVKVQDERQKIAGRN